MRYNLQVTQNVRVSYHDQNQKYKTLIGLHSDVRGQKCNALSSLRAQTNHWLDFHGFSFGLVVLSLNFFLKKKLIIWQVIVKHMLFIDDASKGGVISWDAA